MVFQGSRPILNSEHLSDILVFTCTMLISLYTGFLSSSRFDIVLPWALCCAPDCMHGCNPGSSLHFHISLNFWFLCLLWQTFAKCPALCLLLVFPPSMHCHKHSGDWPIMVDSFVLYSCARYAIVKYISYGLLRCLLSGKFSICDFVLELVHLQEVLLSWAHCPGHESL